MPGPYRPGQVVRPSGTSAATARVTAMAAPIARTLGRFTGSYFPSRNGDEASPDPAELLAVNLIFEQARRSTTWL